MKTICARIKANWTTALADVSASIVGTIGIVFVIAFFVSEQQSDVDAYTSFLQYFRAGQISLPILSVSGIIFVALMRRQSAKNPILALILYVFLIVPTVATAIIIGFNPGFVPGELSSAILTWLWVFYWILHLLWFLVLVSKPVVPTIEETAIAEGVRVNKIKDEAAGRG